MKTILELDYDIELILKKLNNNGRGFLVGGALRDLIMGKVPHDYDFSTNIEYDELKKLFSNFKPKEIGANFGILLVTIGKNSYEIAKFRKEYGSVDNRHPESFEFIDNIEEDLSRRDFTMNAMAYNHELGVIDLFGGTQHIKNKQIVFVGDGELRIEEDALRMLRAFRFVGSLGFDLEKNTKEAIYKQKHLIHNISKERIFQEFSKILTSEHVKKALYEMRDVGFLELIISEFADTYNFNQDNPHHNLDLFDHSVETVANTKADITTRFAALFHDLGKVSTRSVDSSGIAHYHSHEIESAKIARASLNSLKAPNILIDNVCNLIIYHDLVFQNPSNKTIKKMLANIGRYNIDRYIDLLYADNMSKATKNGIPLVDNFKLRIEEIILQEKAICMSDLKFNGRDLITLGFSGKEIGIIKNDVLNAVLSDLIQNEHEKIMEYIKRNYKK